VELNFRDLGQGRPVVLLHGWGMSLEVWDRQVMDLAGRATGGLRTIAVDLRGHGHSPKPLTGYGYDDHVADVAALLARLDLTDVVLVGWSMGGAVAARTAAHCARVSQVVLVGTPARFELAPDFPHGRDPELAAAFYQAIATDREATLWSSVVESFYKSPSPPLAEWLYGLAVQVPSWAGQGCFAAVRAEDVRADIAELDRPVLMMHGVHDAFVAIEGARQLADQHPHVRLVEFQHSGHAPFLEERDLFSATLRTFCQQ
jgi:pimeloyl-ACP methyl ester carboxylesterase